MAATQARDEGDYLPPTPESLQSMSGRQTTSSKSAASLTPRGRAVRFTNFNEAHQNITSGRLASNNPFRKASDPTHSSPGLSNRDFSTSTFGNPITGPKTSPSQDAASAHPSTPAAGTPQFKRRRRSIDSLISLIDFLPEVKTPEMDAPELNNVPKRKAANTNLQPPDTSASTVERIYDQYVTTGRVPLSSSIHSSSHGHTFPVASRPLDLEALDLDALRREGGAMRCGFQGKDSRGPQRKLGENATRENRFQTDSSALQPPQTSLPQAPPIQMRSISTLTRNEDSSPPPTSSVSDSQHLLDADAQIDELRQFRQELIPKPLRIPSNRGLINPGQDKYGKPISDAASSVDNTGESNEDPFKYDGEGYKAFLHPSMERDISQALKRMNKGVGAPSEGILVSPETSPVQGAATKSSVSDPDISPVRNGQLAEDFFDPDALRAVAPGGRRERDIRVVIDRKPQIESDTYMTPGGFNNSNLRGGTHNNVHGRLHKGSTSEGDWVTEATSETDFGSNSGPITKLFGGGIKATGSSIADYSDDNNGHLQGPFGSRDPILQHPTGEGQLSRYGIRRLKDTEQPIIVPRRTNGFPENSIRLYSSNNKDESGFSRPPSTRKRSNPFIQEGYRRGVSSNRLSFKFDRKGPSKYDFRDSTSEYGLAGVSNHATCGTYETLASHSPDNYPSTTDARFDRSADYNADRNPSAKISASRFRDIHTTPQRNYSSQRSDEAFSGSYRYGQSKDLCRRQFAAATTSSWEDEPSSESKFEFELIPLDQAREKYKRERDSGETDETEPAHDRILRKKSTKSGQNAQESSPIEPPLPAHVRQARLARNLSSDFTPPSIQSFQDDVQNMPTPLSANVRGQFSPTPGSGRSFLRMKSALGSPVTPTTTKKGWFRRDKSGTLPVTRDHRMNVAPQTHHSPGDQNPFIAPQDLDPSMAQSRQKYWFYMMATLSILPFFAVLVLTGVFDDSLSWFTRGEYNRLSKKQRSFIKWMLLVECVIYTACLVAIVVYYVTKSKTSS
ncbi:hypothetical protein F5X99DRAFT_423748 [Biscogniauxia marginata]|nr:hypothetical protein F5X99DRAFT_423748 [Biscogniauxia marginata]